MQQKNCEFQNVYKEKVYCTISGHKCTNCPYK